MHGVVRKIVKIPSICQNKVVFRIPSYSTCVFYIYIYVVVNFLFQVIFIFLLFLGMVIYANEVETKEK